MATLAFELVSPEELLMSVDAEMVTLPGEEGDLGILPGHAPLISALRPGVIDVTASEGGRIFIAGGFAEMAGDRLTVLAEEAVPVEKLDRDYLDQQIKNANEDLADATNDEAKLKAESRIARLEDMRAALN